MVQEQDQKADPIGRFTLQYRVARDAFTSSEFVAVTDDGISLPLELIWALPLPEKGEQREALEKQKAQFHKLIEDLEAKVSSSSARGGGSRAGFGSGSPPFLSPPKPDSRRSGIAAGSGAAQPAHAAD